MIFVSSTEIKPQHEVTKQNIIDKKTLKIGYGKLTYGLIGLIVSLILLLVVSLMSIEYVIKSGRGDIISAPIIAILYSLMSLGDGVLKLKRPLYLIAVALLGIGFLLFSGTILLVMLNPFLINNEGILASMELTPRLGALGVALLFLLMHKDLVDQHKVLALIAAIIAFIGVAAFSDITTIIASIIMIYNLHTLTKRL